jgi:hypothetical protein
MAMWPSQHHPGSGESVASRTESILHPVRSDIPSRPPHPKVIKEIAVVVKVVASANWQQ